MILAVNNPANVCWGIALFEYLFQVPANRLGYKENLLSPILHPIGIELLKN
ncbi:MAG: DMT family protein [Bacteroidota bacterium]|nr:DMT family protein [Bacteroidota bacterium]